MRVWDACSGAAVGDPLVGHSGWVSSVAFGVSPSDGRLLVASGSWDKTLHVWDACSGAGDVAAFSLLWTSRSQLQVLDARGSIVSDATALGDAQKAILLHAGARMLVGQKM